MLSPKMKGLQDSNVIFEGEYQTSPGAALSINRRQTVDYLPESLLGSADRMRISERDGSYISPESAQEMWSQSGFKPRAGDTDNTTLEATNLRIQKTKEAAKNEAALARLDSSVGLSARMFAESLGIQFISPINVGSGLLTFGVLPGAGVGVTRGLATSTALRASSRLYAQQGAKMGYLGVAGRGAAEATLGGALVEIPSNPLANYAGYDYTLNDSLLSIAMGAPFGAALHTAPKAFRDASNYMQRKRYEALVPKELADTAMYDNLDTVAIAAGQSNLSREDLIRSVEETIATAKDELRAGGHNVDGVPDAEVPARLEAAAVAEPSRADYYLSEAKKVRDTLEKLESGKNKGFDYNDPQNLKKAIGYTPESLSQFIKKRGGIQEYSGELKSRGITNQKVVGLVKKASADLRTKDALGGESLRQVDYVKQAVHEAGYFPEKQDYNDITDSELYDAIRDDVFGNKKYTQGDAKRINDAIANNEGNLVQQYDRMGISATDDIPYIAKMLEQADNDRERIQAVSPDVRRAAGQVALAQIVDGRPIDIEPVLGTDPRGGFDTPTKQDLERMTSEYIDPEDVDAWEAIEERRAIENEPSMEATQAAELARQAENDEIVFSRGNGNGGSKASDIEVSVRDSFGKYTKQLLEETKIRIVQSTGDLPKGIDYPADVKGAKMQDGTVFIVADNVAPAEVRGLVLHEVGVHTGMRAMLGDEIFGRVLADVMASDEPRVRMAREAVPADTKPEHIAEEALAYLVQNAPDVGIVRSIISAVKAWLIRTFGAKLRVDEFTARSMALGALKRVSRLGEAKNADALFSRVADIEALPSGLTPKITRAENQFSISLVDAAGKEHYFMGVFKDPDGARPHAIIDYVENKSKEYKDVSAALYILAAKEAEKHLGVRLRTGGNELAQKVGEKLKAAGRLDKDRLIISSPTERTAAGEQSVIPGAEKITDKELAERKMEQPLKGKKPQKEMDIGMFGDDAKQTVLFSRGEVKKPEDAPKLADELKVFDQAIKESEKYPEIFKSIITHIGDDPAMRQKLADSGVSVNMINAIIEELKLQHRRVGNQLRKQRRAIKEGDKIEAHENPEVEIAKKAAEAIQIKLLLAKREAAINFVVRQRIIDHVRGFGGKFSYEGFVSMLTGSAMLRTGARDNVAARHRAYLGEWAGATMAGMKKSGVWEMFVSDAVARDVALALERMNVKGADLSKLNPDAVKIATVMNKVQEHSRITQNSLGAHIPYLSSFIVHQSHDQYKIYKMGFDEWYKFTLPKLDLRRMGIRTNPESFMRTVYGEIVAGNYEIDLPTQISDTDFRFGANVAKKVSMSRELIFKEGAWFDYNQRAGSSTVAAAYMKGLDRAAQVSSLMRTLGTNPEYNLRRTIEQVRAELTRSDPAAAKDFGKGVEDKIMNNLAVVDGTANIPGNVHWAKINSNVRLWQMMSKLGGSIFASITDIPNYAANLRYEGRGNMFTGMANAVAGLVSSTKSGVRKDILDALDVMFDHIPAEVIHQLTKNGDFTHNLSAAARIYSKFNLQTQWTSKLQKSAAFGFSNYLGKSASIGFDSLSDDMKRLMKLHNFDAPKWDVLRRAVKQGDDGRVYIVTDALKALPDSVFADYITRKGRTVTDASIAKAREAIATDYRTMVIDRAESAVLSGDKRVEALMHGGTKRGTLWGEVARYIGQFKSYPLMFIERTLKREIQGRGYDTIGDYMKNGKGDMMGMASLMLSMTATGYLSMTIKDALKQKEPRALDKPGTWVQAMKQGGALGLYGDFMLTEYDRHIGSGLADAIGGPAVGMVGDMAEIVTAAVNGDKVATKALRTIQGNVPGANLFYVKPALDNLVMWDLMETMNPGFLRRMEANSVKRTGQDWMMRPSESILRP